MKPCRCGHDRQVHQHYRAGTDCPITGCRCLRYRPRRWWHRTATALPQRTGPHGPLPRHDSGPITYHVRRYRCGCTLIYDGGGRVTGAFGCPTVADLRQWDRELRP